MICNSCGSAVEEFNRFCPKCGAPVQAQSPPPLSSPSPYQSPQAPMMGGPLAQLPKKSSGCGKILLIVGIILLLLGAGIAAAIYFGYQYAEKTLKSSEAYTVALTALKENEEVKEQLGEIKETGFPFGAYSQNADGTGNAAFMMSVQGTKGSGQYDVTMARRNSIWHLEGGRVRTANGTTIPILGKRTTGEDEANVNTNTDTAFPENVNSRGAVSGGVMNGKAISLPQPSYPPIARSAKAAGSVVVQILVNEQGNVISARAVSGHPLLKNVSETAARGAKFEPRIVSGKAVKVTGTLTYNFTAQ